MSPEVLPEGSFLLSRLWDSEGNLIPVPYYGLITTRYRLPYSSAAHGIIKDGTGKPVLRLNMNTFTDAEGRTSTIQRVISAGLPVTVIL